MRLYENDLVVYGVQGRTAIGTYIATTDSGNIVVEDANDELQVWYPHLVRAYTGVNDPENARS